MSSANRVGGNLPTSFGQYLLGRATNISTTSTGNAVANIAILGGGLSNSGATANSGSAILRRLVAVDASTDLSTVTISVGTNTSGSSLYANAQNLTGCSAVNRFQDLTLSATGNTVPLNGNIAAVLYVNVTANAVANGTFDLLAYGDVIAP